MDDYFNEVLGDYKQARKVNYHMRGFVDPEFDSIIVGNRTDPKKIPIRELFPRLGISEERLMEVYEHDGKDFTGRFWPEGKQKLADILGKEVVFWEKPCSAPVTFNPKSYRSQE